MRSCSQVLSLEPVLHSSAVRYPGAAVIPVEGESSLHLKDELPSSLTLKELWPQKVGINPVKSMCYIYFYKNKKKYIYIYQHTKPSEVSSGD